MTIRISRARLAGLLYLVPMVCGPFSMMYVPSVIVVPGDATATTTRLLASERLLRLGMLGDAVIFLTEVALTAVLYVLLKPAGRTLALVATFARLAMTVLQGVNLLPELAALEVLGPASRSALAAGEPEALALVLFELHAATEHVWETFFALHLAVVGVLVRRSRHLPRVLGPLLALAALGYALDGLGHLVFPAGARVFAAVVGITAVVGEAPFALWLAVRGGSRPAPVGRRRSGDGTP